jgi:hypothetical protein
MGCREEEEGLTYCDGVAVWREARALCCPSDVRVAVEHVLGHVDSFVAGREQARRLKHQDLQMKSDRCEQADRDALPHIENLHMAYLAG